MSWVKLDDGFAEHPKVSALTDRAFRLYLTGLCYCARNLTDGTLPPRGLRTVLAGSGATKKHVLELVGAGLWEVDGDEHSVHDYLSYNKTKVDVEHERQLATE